MKRRDFLAASAGLVGTAIPAFGRADVRPCGPGNASVAGGTSTSVACPTSQEGVPSWFAAQAERTWVSVAAPSAIINGTGRRLVDVRADYSGWGGSFASVTAAWTGGCVDQSNGDLLLVANGGHADYSGNEVYSCRIRGENPGWYRLSDPSPPVQVFAALPRSVGGTGLDVSTGNTPTQQGGNPSSYAAMFGDGRMRAQHGWHTQVFHSGRAWFLNQASPTGIGYSTSHAWSWNRRHVNSDGRPIPSDQAGVPQPWEDNPGPWKWLGPSVGGTQANYQSIGTAPPCALDRVSGKIWMPNSDWLSRWMSLDTNTETIRSGAGSFNHGGADTAWAAVVVDPSGMDRWRMFVVPSMNTERLMVLDLKNSDPYSAAAWSFPLVSDFSKLKVTGLGAVYHRPSRAVLLGNPMYFRNGEIVRLTVPVKVDGTYDAAAPWSVTTVLPAGPTENPSSGLIPFDPTNSANQAHSKFNMIEDMGNGQSAIVVIMDTQLPVYVYKLPATGV